MSVPLYLVTGFFGSGKTSFLKYFLEEHGRHKKIAIVQNEFSSSNIDGKEISATADYRVLEINNGSAFCACLLGSFIKSLASFVDEVQPDLLVMEASGMSDPIGVGQIFQSEQLKGKVYLDHIWCVVDAFNFDKMTALRFRMEHQLKVADTIIINKTDIAGEKTEQVQNQIKQINPFARVITGNFSRVDLSIVKNGPVFFAVENTHSAERPDLDSFVIKSNRSITSDKLDAFIAGLKGKCIRVKGYVKIDMGRTVFVQGVFEDYSMTEVNLSVTLTELLLIGNFDHGINYQTIFEDNCIK